MQPKKRHLKRLKNALAKHQACVLADWSKEFHIETDASDTAVGTILFQFKWGATQEEAFKEIKKCISKAPSLCLADWSKEFHIETDASDTAVGTILFQLGENNDYLPLAYHSKNLSEKVVGNRQGDVWSD